MLYQYTNSVLSEKDIVEGVRSYSFRLQYYYDHYVVHESAPDFLHKLSAEYLREYLTIIALDIDSGHARTRLDNSVLKFRLYDYQTVMDSKQLWDIAT